MLFCDRLRLLIKKLTSLFYGLLVKGFNTPPSQGGIHGFETRTGYHLCVLKPLFIGFFYVKKFRYC